MGLEIDEIGVGDGEGQRVSWEALTEVSLVTTAGGPFEDDVFYVLTGRDGTLILTASHPEAEQLLERLQQLPNFDNEAVVAAMACTSAGRFVCWRG